jgi:hypothetical protein
MTQTKKKERPLRKMPLADAISEAFAEFESLATEMRDWADNLEEKFSATTKYETVSASADTLEQYSEPGIPDDLPTIEVEFVDQPPRKRGYSCADRCGQACYILDQCIAVLEEKINELSDLEGDATDPRDSCEQLRDEIENAKGDCESVEFPGMYG